MHHILSAMMVCALMLSDNILMYTRYLEYYLLPYLNYKTKLKLSIRDISLNLAENGFVAYGCCDLLSTKENVYDNITISSELGGNGPQVLVVAGFQAQRITTDDRILALNVIDPMELHHHGSTPQLSVLLQISFLSRIMQ